MGAYSFTRRVAVNNPQLAENYIRESLTNREAGGKRKAERLAYLKAQKAEVVKKSSALVGKRVIAGGRVGKGMRVDPVTGGLIVLHVCRETNYHPDNVSIKV